MPPLKKSERNMLIMIGLAVVVFIFLDPYYFIWRTPEGADAPPQQQQPAGAQQASAASGAADAATRASGKPGRGTTIAAERISLEGWKRDPFVRTRPFMDTAADVVDLRLGAISVRREDRYALINSQVVREGDIVAGMRVEKIERSRVYLSSGGRSFELNWEDKK